MPNRDAAGFSDGRDALDEMGWEALPYGCVGIARKSDIDANRTAWSWLVLIPWARNDAKPWIDGTRILRASTLTPDEERAEILSEMRAVLDKRYGETVGRRATEGLLEGLEGER